MGDVDAAGLLHGLGPWRRKLVGWQINRGPENAADYVSAAQLRDKFFRPDIVDRAIVLASAKAAVREARTPAFTLADLNRRQPPKFTILSPGNRDSTSASPVAVSLNIEANEDPISAFDVTVNGRQVTQREARGLVRLDKGARSESLSVPLEAGENRIRIVAKNAVGQTAAELLLNLAAAQGALDRKGKLYLVAAGVDDYSKLGVQNLAFAGADASALHETLLAKAQPLYSEIKVCC